MFRPDRAALRSAGFVVLLTGVFVVVNSQVVYAAGNTGESGDLLSPLDIASSEGVPISGYELNASGGSIVAFKTQALAFALSGLFTLIRLLVGLAGWAVELAFRFPLLKILARPAQKVADTYTSVVVETLGLKGLLLAWAFVFAGFMIVRGRVGRGLGEIFLTLLIGALASSTLIRPDTLLGTNGPLGQSQQVAAEVARQSVASYDWGGKLASTDPCDGLAGGAEIKCLQREGEGPVSAAEVARPLQDSITNALIVKPYMLLQYGRILDPAKPSERKAYAVHLKWITGGYKVGAHVTDEGRAACKKVHGPAKKHCESGYAEGIPKADEESGGLPAFTPGGQLLDASSALVDDEDREFYSFVQDMKRSGAVGKSCAAYAEKPTWWRIGGAALLLVAAGFICGMLLSSAIVLLGTQGICAAAAAAGAVTFVAGMLPGPARQSVWKWLSLWGISVVAVVAVCAFVPFFGIAVDATITNGPDLMVERILLIDVLAIAGAAGHRRLLASITSFGRRAAMRMRYAKVGGTHLPGDTSELGAALAMNSPAAGGGYGGGLRAFTGGGGGGRFGLLGTRQRLMGALASFTDGAGMPVDTGGMLADARAEARRGLAPLAAAAAVGGLGTRLGVKGGHWLLIGRRPDREQLAKWRKPTADDGAQAGGPPGTSPGGSGGGLGGAGPLGPGGPPDRFRGKDGLIVDRRSGQVLHDQSTDRTLLSTRAHNRLVRFRGYRILHRGGRVAYGATAGLPASAERTRSAGSRYAQDARQQVQVWGNTVREDGRAWADAGRHVAGVVRENSDSGGRGPFVGRRLPVAASTRSPGPARPARSGGSSGGPVPSAPPGRASASGISGASRAPSAGAPPRQQGGAPQPLAGSSPSGPALPGIGSAGTAARNEARIRMQELMRRTAPEAERLRHKREQARQRDVGGEDG
ncbi:hypothetical protein [Streptomyces sp. NPDC059371]|uniref:hypothetical protein n=1 Tax=Streptomyces sp. NPDC059371 TaxID=3346812 RepID=UPI0036964356